MAVNENKWGLLYCPRGGWRSAKRWEKIEKVLRQQVSVLIVMPVEKRLPEG